LLGKQNSEVIEPLTESAAKAIRGNVTPARRQSQVECALEERNRERR
jgi:hypothetical protein